MGEISGDAAHSRQECSLAEQQAVLDPLADELMAIALRLRKAALLPEREDAVIDRPSPRAARSTCTHLALARKAYALRRKRAAIFGNPDLFGEPAWDILLDLFIAHAEGKAVSVSSACIGSASPATTGLRWLGVLADEGLIQRENDADDNRRVLVRLSKAGLAAMERFFDAEAEAGS
ncbi:MarR family transcriptional regulator [Porphyrobacter sp. AAP60]|uniref:MarR family transcriptional regulator n=1 Tax=Porphyrobacter sp. AAP60 TaxID=1523423 RepID=UPI0006CD7AD7|nr:MarR family transcriptional regulator [Porphyrobacter sp. AAP60]KPF65134.1 hypothetical protein IP79_02830 [Porphyrobacter sp. AAP60]